MINRSDVRIAQAYSWELFRKAGVPVREDERDNIEIVDFDLNHFQTEGMHLLSLVATDRYVAKVLALSPRQTEPEHWHPPYGDDPGKQETVRVAFGTLYFYLPGEAELAADRIPEGKESVYTCRREIIMKPGDQLTMKPGEKHWFRAGSEGAVIYTFSSTARDILDGFSDPDIRRKTTIIEDR